MKELLMNPKCRTFLLTAFAVAWILQLAASYFAWHGNSIAFGLILAVSMYAPFLGVLAARIPLRDMGWKPSLRDGKWKWILTAWIGLSVLAALGAALYFLLFPSRLDLTGAMITAQLGEEAAVQLTEQGLTPPVYLLISVVQSMTWAPWVNMLAALGEEVGWRGALYPMLKQRFGTARGRILGGIIWGMWHWPVMILAGYEYGLSYPGAPFLGPPLFCLCTFSWGTLIDYLYEKTNCIWVPALAHGAVNAFAGVPLLLLDPAFADQLILGPCTIGIIAMLPTLAAALFVLRRGSKTVGVSLTEML